MSEDVSSKLISLLHRAINREISVVDFCDLFGVAFNIDNDKINLSDFELMVFSDLFNEIVWYSPYQDERMSIKNYIDEAAVLKAINNAVSRLEN